MVAAFSSAAWSSEWPLSSFSWARLAPASAFASPTEPLRQSWAISPEVGQLRNGVSHVLTCSGFCPILALVADYGCDVLHPKDPLHHILFPR